MEQSTARVRRHRASRARRGLLVAAVCIASIAILGWMELGVFPMPTFVGACTRLRESGLRLLPQDWFCHRSTWQAHLVAGSGLVSIALMLPGVALAATGRRLTALLPLIVGGLFEGWWIDMTSWGSDRALGSLASRLLLAAPAVAIMWTRPRPRLPRDRIRLVPAIGSGIAIAAAAKGTLILSHRLLVGHGLADIELTASAVTIGIFAALLGPDRRWWPWILAPVAIFLSGAPLGLTPVDPELRGWWYFVNAVPLAFVGLVCSVWRPLATWLATRMTQGSPATAMPRQVPTSSRIVGLVAVNAVALGLVAACATAPTDNGGELPTFLEERQSVEDWRTQMDLRAAMRAMDAYFSENGTYTGFDSEEGLATEPALTWLEGVGSLNPWAANERPTVAIILASRREARVASFSGVGTAICFEHARGGGISYGISAEAKRGEALQSAIENCGSVPWSDESAQPPPLPSCPADVRDYILCRMVQVHVHNLTEREPRA